jgi:tungstate transport system ATP-binding protein
MEKNLIYSIKSLKFFYTKKIILDIANLEIKKGRIYALIGSNGSGKTTLMKIMNALLKVKKPEIFYKSNLISHENYRLVRSETVYIHQSPLLLTGTVFNNIAYGLKLRRFNEEQIKNRVISSLESLGLSQYLNRKTRELSTGEIQKIAIARAAVLFPEVLLLDEPTANVDSESLIMIEKLILNLKKNYNTTIIFSTHNSFFDFRMCDEIIKLENGKIV